MVNYPFHVEKCKKCGYQAIDEPEYENHKKIGCLKQNPNLKKFIVKKSHYTTILAESKNDAFEKVEIEQLGVYNNTLSKVINWRK